MHGNSIHAQIYPPLTEKFKHLLKEERVYNLSFIQIRKANKQYKSVENDIMINFTKWTTVEEVVEIPPAFPVITYSLTPLEKIPSKVDKNEYFTGIFGPIVTLHMHTKGCFYSCIVVPLVRCTWCSHGDF